MKAIEFEASAVLDLGAKTLQIEFGHRSFLFPLGDLSFGELEDTWMCFHVGNFQYDVNLYVSFPEEGFALSIYDTTANGHTIREPYLSVTDFKINGTREDWGEEEVEEEEIEYPFDTPHFIREIDWALLRSQKQYLVNIQQNVPGLTNRESEALEGILNLIDGLQDYAVDTCGIPEDKIFKLSNDDGEEGN